MPAEQPASYIRISRFGWLAIAGLLLAPWMIVLWLVRAGPTPVAAGSLHDTAATIGKKAAAVAKPNASQGAVGPWGKLSYYRILIEPPEEIIPPAFTTPQPIRWTFKGYQPESLDSLWREAGLSDTQRQALNQPEHRTTNASGLVLSPPAEVVLELTVAARTKIYGVLAAFPENGLQCDPFRSRAEAIDDWFAGGTLRPEIVDLTRRLLYPRNNNLLFSDHDLVLPRLSSTAERVRYIKTLSRKSALLVQAHVSHGADTEEMSRYWGRGRRSKDVGALLESLARRPEGGEIDIVHLLPSAARRLLYTYPTPSERSDALGRDCHWTSFNFFNAQPDERFLTLEFVEQTLLNDYYQAGGEPLMGDILLLVRDGNAGVHSCVYIADNIVFTKNGAAFSVPWTLARLEDVIAFYSIAGPLEVRRYRAK